MALRRCHTNHVPDPTTPDVQPPIVAVVGATASGKSAVLDLAERSVARSSTPTRCNCTPAWTSAPAKQLVAERRGILTHLLDVLEVTEPASVAVFQQQARAIVAEIRGRGATPVLVGGSALYTRAVLDRFDFPGTDDEVRGRWEAELDRVGSPALHAVLAGRDPEAASGILPDNGRRVVRALEVIEPTWSPTAPCPAQYVEPAHGPGRRRRRRDELDRRIESRVDAMFESGLVDEVVACSRPASPRAARPRGPSAIREVAAYLLGETDRGRGPRGDEGRDPSVRRRQDPWSRKDPRGGVGAVDDPMCGEMALAAVRLI